MFRDAKRLLSWELTQPNLKLISEGEDSSRGLLRDYESSDRPFSSCGVYHPHPGARRGLFHYYRIPLEVYIINVQSYTLLQQTSAFLTKGQKDFRGYLDTPKTYKLCLTMLSDLIDEDCTMYSKKAPSPCRKT